jgi:ankyrin repeat protein
MKTNLIIGLISLSGALFASPSGHSHTSSTSHSFIKEQPAKNSADHIDQASILAGTTELSWIPLHAAVRLSDGAKLKELLEAGAAIDAQNPDGCTALHWAAMEGKVGCLKILIDGNASLNAQDKKGCTALYYAAYHNRIDCVNLLIASGADISLPAQDGTTPLHASVGCSRDSVHESGRDIYKFQSCDKGLSMMALLETGADPDQADNEGRTPLYKAAKNGDLTSVNALIARSADLETADNVAGYTPLLIAAFNGETECVKALLAAGANRFAETADIDLANVLQLAAQSSKKGCLEYLLDNGFDENELNAFGQTLLFYASRCSLECTQFLIDRGFDVNAKDNANLTPLHQAALSGSTGTMKLLLAAGADISVVDNDGMTPFLYACAACDLEGVNLLLSNNPFERYHQLKSSNSSRHTALYKAAGSENMPVLEFLLNQRIDVGALDTLGQSPLMVAVIEGKEKSVTALLPKTYTLFLPQPAQVTQARDRLRAAVMTFNGLKKENIDLERYNLLNSPFLMGEVFLSDEGLRQDLVFILLDELRGLAVKEHNEDDVPRSPKVCKPEAFAILLKAQDLVVDYLLKKLKEHFAAHQDQTAKDTLMQHITTKEADYKKLINQGIVERMKELTRLSVAQESRD